MTLNSLSRLYHTLRHLKPIQFYWRVYLRFNDKHPSDILIDQVTTRKLNCIEVINRPLSFHGDSFRFLNHPLSIKKGIEWNNPDLAKLWLYNLHYADYLQQEEMDQKTGLDLMSRWIEANPPSNGNGWEPYPLSLRIVNWVKFLVRFDLDQETIQPVTHSLYRQARSLRKQLEFHLLGNHLFKNAVALLYVGYFFEDEEAQEWYEKGKKILIDQLDEQVLADGGHFERSPMYHALILEDILDCLNLVRSSQDFDNQEFDKSLKTKAKSMLGFLNDIIHPDGSFPVFNDTAQGIASTPKQLFSYAQRLNLDWAQDGSDLIEKQDFGLVVLNSMQFRCIIDAGVIGPDYLPGHAHCDTLSYELSLQGQLIVVNAGVFQYAGEERNVYRATRSHNTVEINHAEQHEIWSTFRVARRGYPQNVSANDRSGELFFTGQHTGYQRLNGKPIHQREIHLAVGQMNVIDRVIGKGEHSAKSFIHFHPEVEIISKSNNQLQLKKTNSTFFMEIPEGLDWLLNDYEYSAEFGLKEKANVITITASGSDDFSIPYSFSVG